MNTSLSKKLGIVLSMVLAGFANTPSVAQDRPIQEVQAAVIYNVIKYIQWANENDGKDSFVIGVLGDDKLYTALSIYQNKPKGTKKISVNKLSSADQATSCDLFFLGQPRLKDFEKAKELTNQRPTLFVTSADTYGQKGSSVNLNAVDNKLVIEINEPSINGSGFRVSGSLMSMAKVIK
jgi:hypothetical protein